MKLGNPKSSLNLGDIIKILLLTVCHFTLSQTKCYDRPECFKKVVFNINFPEMNLFQINGTSNAFTDYSIKAYGDFNNDL